MRAKRKTGSSFSLFGRGAPDEDEELMTARFELTRLEGEFFEVAKSVDKLSRARKGGTFFSLLIGYASNN